MFCLVSLSVAAQEKGSEKELREQLTSGKLNTWQQAMTLGNLAHIVFYRRDHAEGFDIIKQALYLVRDPRYRPYRAYLCSMLGTMYSDDHEQRRARQYIDSALYYIRSIQDRDIKGQVWYTDGWLKYREDKPQKAIASYLKGVTELQQVNNLNSYFYQSAIFGEIARIYEQWRDVINQAKYSRLNLEAATKTNAPNLLTAAHYNMGNSFMSLYQDDTLQRRFLDSALYYNKRCIAIIQQHEGEIVHLSEQALAAYNIAEIYLDHMPDRYRDSASRYLDMAVAQGKKTEDHLTLSKTYLLWAVNELKVNEIKNATMLAAAATSELYQSPVIDDQTQLRLFRLLASLSEKNGDLAEQLRYYKEYIRIYRNVFDNEKMSIGKRLEAQYESVKKEKALLEAQFLTGQKDKELILAKFESGQKDQALLTARYDASEKDKALLAAKYETGLKEQALTTARYRSIQKEQELKTMQQTVSYNKKLNKIYSVLTIACFLALLFLFYAYKQRSKTLAQEKQLHQLEVDKIRQEHRISLLSAMLEGQEQERTRLARDLHDGLGGLLSGVKIELSGLDPLTTDPRQQVIVSKTMHHLDNAVDELRRIAKSMMPEVLLVYGLGEACKEYCNGLRKSGVPVTCQVYNYKNDMSPSRQVILYRIMQELINNAVKHAGATQIFVQLQQNGDVIFLTVEDDGKGFDTQKLNELKGAGLANIRARVELLHGRMDIESTSGTGTSFTIECSTN